MDCPDKILPSGTPACTAGLTPMTRVGDLPLDVTVTPDVHAMTAGTDLDSVTPNPTPITTAIGVVAVRTLAEVTPDHSTDLPIAQLLV